MNNGWVVGRWWWRGRARQGLGGCGRRDNGFFSFSGAVLKFFVSDTFRILKVDVAQRGVPLCRDKSCRQLVDHSRTGYRRSGRRDRLASRDKIWTRGRNRREEEGRRTRAEGEREARPAGPFREIDSPKQKDSPKSEPKCTRMV